MSILKPAPASEGLVVVESSPAHAEQLSSMGKDRRSAVRGIVALFGLGATGLLNEACGPDAILGYANEEGDSDAPGNKGKGGNKGKPGDYEDPSGDSEGSRGGDYNGSKGNGDYDYQSGDTDNPGDAGGGDNDVDLDGQDCTPEGSRWSPDGECYCAPEGSCNSPGSSCQPPCAKDTNNVCRPPNKWRCF